MDTLDDERYHSTTITMGQTTRNAFQELVTTARRLQAPGGCRWDRAQTVSSLLPYLVEEAWEVFEVIRRRQYQELEEELGDALYTVLLLTLAAERLKRHSPSRQFRRRLVREWEALLNETPRPPSGRPTRRSGRVRRQG